MRLREEGRGGEGDKDADKQSEPAKADIQQDCCRIFEARVCVRARKFMCPPSTPNLLGVEGGAQ